MEAEKFAKPNGAEFVPPIVEAPVDLMPITAVTRRSPSIGKLVEALAQAQLEFAPVSKDQDNPYYHSKYADLSTVISATRTALAKHSLVIVQHSSVDVQRQRLTLTSTLAHSSDQWIENELTLPAIMLGKDGRPRFDAQSCGAAMTYARRYAYQGLVGVAAELDDDGNSAIGIGPKQAAQDVAKKGLEEKLNSPDPKIRKMAQDGLAAIRAKEQSKSADLTGVLQQSIAAVPKAHIPLEESLESAKNDGMFDEIGGVITQVREMVTTPAKGSKPYRRIAMAVVNKQDGEMKDIELVSWDNLLLSDGHLWDFLENATDSPAVFLCEVSEYKGKPSYTVRDVKGIGTHSWDARVGAIQQGAR